MTTDDIMKPDFARNMRLLGYSDQGGRADGVQIMVMDGYAYIGHMFSNGFSVVDVRDPRNPKTVNYIPTPPGRGVSIFRHTTTCCLLSTA